ncbi:MAG: 23S rRNA (adenine(2503)-C(2))-methyltransferase RlmN [Candidatus Marinimicrobia bacterium]|nr:23S rRNA (adenine(2503)-C(2))-methyltransferase RlmN [Candidatus Neomarinimicrobiota bacterium]
MLQQSKIVLKGMMQQELQGWCKSVGETSFRGIQLFEWMYKKGVSDPNLMLNISHKFRGFLKENSILSTLKLELKTESQLEQTTKYLFKLADNQFIETVSMVMENRHTVCISSQIGCSIDCDFCATGKMGFNRNLSVGEIVDQLIYVRNNIANPITNIVYMGMGEPFLNYERVIKSAEIFHNPLGFNLGRHRITISTAGILPKIKQFINEEQKFKLAISLNASNNITRDKIMPINKKWNIQKIIKEVKQFSLLNRRRIMFEYVLMKEINDSPENAIELAELLSGINCKLNIIPYNESVGIYKRPDEKSLNRFLKILHERQNGYRILVRWSKGQDIAAGCGQLVYKEKIAN